VLGRRLRQRGVADVVAGIEMRVVDPHRARLGERRVRKLLAVARDEMQPVLDLRDEVVVGRRLAVEDEHGTHVHVRPALLEGEKRCVEAGEPVGVGHVHRLWRVRRLLANAV
jgi:hypothetical protein